MSSFHHIRLGIACGDYLPDDTILSSESVSDFCGELSASVHDYLCWPGYLVSHTNSNKLMISSACLLATSTISNQPVAGSIMVRQWNVVSFLPLPKVYAPSRSIHSCWNSDSAIDQVCETVFLKLQRQSFTSRAEPSEPNL